MVFKRIMAKLGKGGAQVDLVLNKEQYQLGETVKGELVIRGGTIPQEINKINIDFMVQIKKGEQVHIHRIERFSFDIQFVVHPLEKKIFPFEYTLSENLLLSGYAVSYFFVTHLDIVAGIDYFDRDAIIITPPPRFQNIIYALELFGFLEKYGSRSFNGYLQKFSFVPSHFFKDQVEELDFFARIEKNGIRLLMELEMKGPKEGDIKTEVFLPNELLDDVTTLSSHLKQLLNEIASNPKAYYHKPGNTQKYWISVASAIGGFALGLLGKELLDEAADEVEDESIEEILEPELEDLTVENEVEYLGDLFDEET